MDGVEAKVRGVTVDVDVVDDVGVGFGGLGLD